MIDEDDDLRAARGIAKGIKYGLFLWILIALFVAVAVS